MVKRSLGHSATRAVWAPPWCPWGLGQCLAPGRRSVREDSVRNQGRRNDRKEGKGSGNLLYGVRGIQIAADAHG